jgi:hypothetical protein
MCINLCNFFMSFKRIIKNVQGLFWRNSVTNGDNAGVMSLLSTYWYTRHSIKWSVMGC